MTPVADYTISAEVAAGIRSWRSKCLIAGAIGAIASVAGAVMDWTTFIHSYLWAYIYFFLLTIGCIGLLMLQYVTGGAWGMMIRRIAEAVSRTLWLFVALFIPIWIGIPKLYQWVDANFMKSEPGLQQKTKYLNIPFFTGRAVVYFLVWFGLVFLLNKWSAERDRTGNVALGLSLERVAAFGLIFHVFATTFMSLDWASSIDPGWFSTMYGLLFVAGQGLEAFAFLIIMMVCLSHRGPFAEAINRRHLLDTGKLMFAFVMLFAYFSFSQFLIIWSGNLPEEIPWYLERLRGGWQFVASLLVIGHFALPFALLLSRDLKKNGPILRNIAAFILIMRMVDVYWQIMPAFSKGQFTFHWTDIAAPLGIGGIWLFLFLGELLKRPLLPVGDPALEGAIAHGRH